MRRLKLQQQLRNMLSAARHSCISQEFCHNILLKLLFKENKIDVGRLKEALVDDPDEMFQLADLLDGVSVDGVDISTESVSPGRYRTWDNVLIGKSRVCSGL